MKTQFSPRLVHPKSPDVEALLSSELETKSSGQAGEKEGKSLSLQFGDFSDVTPCTVVKTPELEAYLEVPWEVPKLRKKLQSRKKKEEFIQGSDSGISMSSQETREPAPWLQLQAPKLRRRLELDDNGGGGAAPVRPGSGSDGESRRSLCLSHEQASNSSVAANAEFLVQSYPGPRPASMVSASLGIGCRSTAEDGGEREAGAVKLGEEIADQGLEELGGNGESFQPPPDISDLPFSMPKLARRLGQPPSSSSSPPFKLQAAPRPSLSLNIAPPSSKACSSQPSSPTSPLRAKPFKTRPMSLVQENPLNLPQHNRPGEKTFLNQTSICPPGVLPLAGSSSGPFGQAGSSAEPRPGSMSLRLDQTSLGGSAPASALPSRKKPLLFLAPSR